MKRFIRCSLEDPFRLCCLLACLLVFSVPAHATRLAPELKTAVQAVFPDAKFRLDGSVETKNGQLFLPLSPPKPPVEKYPKPAAPVSVKEKFVAAEQLEAVSFSNGWCFLRVLKKGAVRTVINPAALTEPLRKQLLVCKFVSDLIVPENFSVPKALKPAVGDLAIAVAADAAPKPKTTTGQAGNTASENPAEKKPATAHGAIFVGSPATGVISMLDGSTWEKVTDFPTEGTPAGMTVADGRLYIADQGKSRILVLDPKKKQFLGQIDLTPKSAPRGLASLPNGKLLYASESAAGNIDVIETETSRVLLKTKVAAGPSRIAMAPNGNVLIVLNPPSGQVTLITTSNQKVWAAVKVGSMPNSVVFSKDSAYAYVTNRNSNNVTIVDITKRQAIANMPTGAAPTGLVITNDGEKLLVANAKDNTITVFDLAKRTKIQDVKLPLDVDFPGALYMMPDGQHVIVSSASTDTVGILNVEKLEFEKQPVLGHTSDEMLWLSLD